MNRSSIGYLIFKISVYQFNFKTYLKSNQTESITSLQREHLNLTLINNLKTREIKNFD